MTTVAPVPDPFAAPETPEGHPFRVAILGAGPIGLDAALGALEAGFDVRVWEAGDEPAHHVRGWAHVRLFSPWSMNRSPRMDRALAGIGRPLAVDEARAPTGRELLEHVLDPLWAEAVPAGTLRTGHRVLAVGREGLLKHEEISSDARARRPFRILLRGPDGEEFVRWADRVVDCTGVRGQPNTLGTGGVPAPGEAALAHRLGRAIPDDPSALAGHRVAVVGAGHSAQTAVVRLAGESALAELVWVVRDPEPRVHSGEDDPLEERRRLTAAAQALLDGESDGIRVLAGREVQSLSEGTDADPEALVLELSGPDGAREVLEVDEVLALVGSVGDASLYRQLQVHECYATSGPMKLAAALLGSGGGNGDCLSVEAPGGDTLKNPEPGFWILGEKSYGRNPTFLLRNGWTQVDQVLAQLGAAGAEAARTSSSATPT